MARKTIGLGASPQAGVQRGAGFAFRTRLPCCWGRVCSVRCVLSRIPSLFADSGVAGSGGAGRWAGDAGERPSGETSLCSAGAAEFAPVAGSEDRDRGRGFSGFVFRCSGQACAGAEAVRCFGGSGKKRIGASRCGADVRVHQNEG